MKKKILFAVIIIAAAILIYKYFEKQEEYYTDYTGDIEIIAANGNVPELNYLDQNWNEQTREDFWFTSQGSDVLPYDFFTYLEQPYSSELFRNTDYLNSFGFIPRKSSIKNPSGLPVGFAITRHREGIPRALGFTCATCHSNQINYKGKGYLVEGAPSLANFDKLQTELVKALDKTLNDPEKFERFADNILNKTEFPVKTPEDLKAQLRQVYNANKSRQDVNALPENYPLNFSGNGRVDAFGEISNEGTAFALNDLGNKNYPNAPVSYPFLWGTHQSDVVQWNASAPNTPIIGPLARNVGEVVGVYGGLKMTKEGNKINYSSTVDYRGLGQLETWVKNLRSPKWPASLQNDSVIKQGSALYQQHCASCHQVIPRKDEGMLYIANKTPISVLGTDPLVAENINNNKAFSLILEGRKETFLSKDRFPDRTQAIKIPVNGVFGLILQNPILALKAGAAPLESESLLEKLKDIEEYIAENLKARDTLAKGTLVYKGRPLNGIWATAPYLHNGSVPNLWELLKDPKDRVKEFYVGNRQLDTIDVGFNMQSGPFLFKVLREDGTIMPGNSNLGHAYGTTLSETEKRALIEYMKTL